MDKVARLQNRVEFGVIRQKRRLAGEAIAQEPAHERVFNQRIAGPVGGIEIADDEEFGRGVKAEFDSVGVDRPPAF